MPYLDARLLEFYERELRHLRLMAGEFAQQFPKIAGRLSINPDGVGECRDPYVERLLEGFAFLAARVQLKLESEFPRFTNALLENVYPQFLAPVPSMAVVQYEPDYGNSSLAEGVDVAAGSKIFSHLDKHDKTRCVYRTAHAIKLWPLRVQQAEYHVQNLQVLQLPQSPSQIKAAIRIRLEGVGVESLNNFPIDELSFHLRGEGELPMRLYEEIFAHARYVYAKPADHTKPLQQENGYDSIHREGFEDDQALLPPTARSFQGYRLIQEYFTLPQRFLYFKLSGLRKWFEQCEGNTLDLILGLDRAIIDLSRVTEASNFVMYSTPVINLFSKRADRIHLSHRFSEHHVVPDRTRLLDFEVFQVKAVTGYGLRREESVEFRPFYALNDLDGSGDGAYFVVNRVPRMLSENEKRGRRRSISYSGSEVFINIVDANAAPYHPDMNQLAVETLCTNRDLPLSLPQGFSLATSDFDPEHGEMIRAVHCIEGPTKPLPSRAEGPTTWKLISHLSLNYLSLVDQDADHGAVALREMLRLYTEPHDPDTAFPRNHVEGVRSIHCQAITRRVLSPGPVTFARGLGLTVLLEERMFKGIGAFLFGAVLEHFFAKYVTINSFTETSVHSKERGELIRWPKRNGQRHLI